MKICLISSNYPTPWQPAKGIFVEQHVKEWENAGVEVNVVAPISIPDILRSLNKKRVKENFAGSNIIRPIFFSISNKRIGKLDLSSIRREQIKKAALRGIKKFDDFDLIYGKFLMSGGYAALAAGEKHKKPVIVDLGESRLTENMKENDLKLAREIIPKFDGIACVSKRLVQEVLDLGADRTKVLYAPNTVDINQFNPLSKKECRNRLNLNEEDFIIIFVGHFIKRKGPFRVLEAINSLDINVKGIFIGSGEKQPKGEKVLFSGPVPHNELPIWLNASDVFVLPTLAEGYCNAINEAVACGLPVISSDIPDVRQQISEENGILLNPLDVKGISMAIKSLYKNKEKLAYFSENNKLLSKLNFNIKRSHKILSWANNNN